MLVGLSENYEPRGKLWKCQESCLVNTLANIPSTTFRYSAQPNTDKLRTGMYTGYVSYTKTYFVLVGLFENYEP